MPHMSWESSITICNRQLLKVAGTNCYNWRNTHINKPAEYTHQAVYTYRHTHPPVANMHLSVLCTLKLSWRHKHEVTVPDFLLHSSANENGPLRHTALYVHFFTKFRVSAFCRDRSVSWWQPSVTELGCLSCWSHLVGSPWSNNIKAV